MENKYIEILSRELNNEQISCFIDTLEILSENASAKTENNRYLTQIQEKAINFDRIKEIYENTVLRKEGISLYKGLKSNDALYINDSGWYFIEFKAGKNVDAYELYKKIYDSLMILWDIDKLDMGWLKVDGKQSKLELNTSKPDFQLASKFKEMGFQNSLAYVRENFHYILVYHSEYMNEYKSEMDKKGFMAKLENFDYEQQISVFERNKKLFHTEMTGFEYLKKQIQKGQFYVFLERIQKIREIEEHVYDEEAEYLQSNELELKKILDINKNVNDFFKDEKNFFGKSGQEILKVLTTTFCCTMDEISKFLKDLRKRMYLAKLNEGQYDSRIKVWMDKHLIPCYALDDERIYLKNAIQNNEFEMLLKNDERYDNQIAESLAKIGGISKELFFLFQFENVFFKSVKTLDEKEFDREFKKMLNVSFN